nr:hypothetical protein [Tanacetum cinerariifolium]
MEVQPEITQNISSLKLPMLKTRDYDLWKIEVQKLARKKVLKAKSTLLLAIPDEHLLKFHSIKDANSLWKAIKIRSKGMDKTTTQGWPSGKKICVAVGSNPVDYLANVSETMVTKYSLPGQVTERCKHKATEELTSAWNNITLIIRNKPNIDTLSMDDLYNNIKVYEAKIKRQSSSGSNYHNVAFVSSENTSIINEAINDAHDILVTGSKEQPYASSYADDTIPGGSNDCLYSSLTEIPKNPFEAW